MADKNKLPWDVSATEAVGKAVPNEISKWSSWYRWLEKIPVVGTALSVILGALGGADAGATTYSDVWQLEREKGKSGKESRLNSAIPAVTQAIKGYSGGANPGIYGTVGPVENEWADYIGKAGNLVGGITNLTNSQGIGNVGKAGYGVFDSGMDIYNAATGQEKRPQYTDISGMLSSLFGNGITTNKQPSQSKQPTQGMYGGAKGTDLSISGISNMFGNRTAQPAAPTSYPYTPASQYAAPSASQYTAPSSSGFNISNLLGMLGQGSKVQTGDKYKTLYNTFIEEQKKKQKEMEEERKRKEQADKMYQLLKESSSLQPRLTTYPTITGF